MKPSGSGDRPAGSLGERPLAWDDAEERGTGSDLPGYPRSQAVTAPSARSVELFRAVKSAIVVGCDSLER
jgi:hypothetical protein